VIHAPVPMREQRPVFKLLDSNGSPESKTENHCAEFEAAREIGEIQGELDLLLSQFPTNPVIVRDPLKQNLSTSDVLDKVKEKLQRMSLEEGDDFATRQSMSGQIFQARLKNQFHPSDSQFSSSRRRMLKPANPLPSAPVIHENDVDMSNRSKTMKQYRSKTKFVRHSHSIGNLVRGSRTLDLEKQKSVITQHSSAGAYPDDDEQLNTTSKSFINYIKTLF
jgi:hypothetical protein